jgi:short subunit dehydrogenase-like uncharacterized protein
MASPKRVVVYAASGYTGRLTCESLARLHIPFVAAGRNLARLEEVVREMRAKGADCVAHATEHTPLGLRSLLRGAGVVLNTSGPFSLLGHAVVDAALVEGCHYMDSTGEQDFMLDVRTHYGQAFEDARLLLSPSAAFLWGPGTVAAEYCLEKSPDVDSLEVVYAPQPLQTVASLQSMVRVARRPGYAIVDGELRRAPGAEVKRVSIPGSKPRGALRIGAGEATFFLGDARVRRCDTWLAIDELARAAPAFALWGKLSTVISGDTLDRWSDALVLRLKKNPPAEQPQAAGFAVTVTAQGRERRVDATLTGTCPYVVTGFLLATAAKAVLEGRAHAFGYRSLGQAFGARYVLDKLEDVGTRTTFDGLDLPRTPVPGPVARIAPPSGAVYAHR